MKNNYTHILFILDESGSMYGEKDDVIGGFNNFLEAQKKVAGECTVSLVKFSTPKLFESKMVPYTEIYNFVNLQHVAPLSLANYSPSGGTALFDTVGAMIDSTGARLAEMQELDRPEKVIVVILTDGQENSSLKMSLEDVKQRIVTQTQSYNWQFVFIGAGLDAFQDGNRIGIMASSTLSSSKCSKGYADMYSGLSRSVTSYRCGTSDAVSFTQEDVDNQIACGVDPSVANKSITP